MRRAAAGLLLAPIVLAGCGDGSATGARGAPPPVRHVVLLVLDACHGDQLSCQGGLPGLTPNLDRAAAAGVRFDRACANAAWTLPSTTSLLTGLLPEEHGVVTDAQRAPETLLLLPEILREAGWGTAGFVQMVYASDAYGLQQGFDDYRYYGTGEKRDDRLLHDVLAWMDAHAGERTFLYVHARRPHGPYNPEPQDLRRAGARLPPASPERLDILSQADAMVQSAADLAPGEDAVVRQLYCGNLATIDATLRPLIERALADPGTLLVVTADHGEALGQHGVFGHGSHVWAETLDIPLIIVAPGLPEAVDHGPAFGVDVLPTILELCATPHPHAADASIPAPAGRSLRQRLVTSGGAAADDPATRTPTVIAARVSGPDSMPAIAVVTVRHKLILAEDGSVRLFDRLADRREEHDLADSEPDLVAHLRALAESGRQAVHRAARGTLPEPSIDDQRAADLDSLGYAR